MSNTTETLTKKLHARADRRLEGEIKTWLAAMPKTRELFGLHNIPCGGSHLSAALYAVEQSLIAHLTPRYHECEVTEFLAQVNTLQDVLDNQ